MEMQESLELDNEGLSEDSLTDWTYEMREEMQLITRGVYLGPYAVASKSKLQLLLSSGITHIVCVRGKMEARFVKPNFPDNFKYLIVEVRDSSWENILRHLEDTLSFMHHAVNEGGRVLVHGMGGISRSAAIVIAYVMRRYSMSFKEAYKHVSLRRFCINPNQGFRQQLREYEPIYKARLQCQSQDMELSTSSGELYDATGVNNLIFPTAKRKMLE